MKKIAKVSMQKTASAARKHTKKINMDSLNVSFSELQRTKMTKSAAEARKAAKIVSLKGKITVPSQETVKKTSDDLAQLLKDF